MVYTLQPEVEKVEKEEQEDHGIPGLTLAGRRDNIPRSATNAIHDHGTRRVDLGDMDEKIAKHKKALEEQLKAKRVRIDELELPNEELNKDKIRIESRIGGLESERDLLHKSETNAKSRLKVS